MVGLCTLYSNMYTVCEDEAVVGRGRNGINGCM